MQSHWLTFNVISSSRCNSRHQELRSPSASKIIASNACLSSARAIFRQKFSRLSQVLSHDTSASTSYQYDAAGNLQSDGLRQYHYDSQGRLQSSQTGQGPDAPTTRYAHNALGQRVFKTEALYSTSSGLSEDDEEDLGFLQSIAQFFTRLWSPKNSEAEHLGWAYLYDEEGSLVGEYGMGGANSGGQGQYFYLPTASGPMPIAAEIDGRLYAIHSDHLNTPRHLTQADGQPAWQWAYSAYGDEAPTLGARRFTDETTKPTTGSTGIAPVRFNLRYPGQYFDEETGLHYNYFRSYDPRVGRYTQSDPIGLDGGWNRFGYVANNPLSFVDIEGLNPRGFPKNPLELTPLEGGGGGMSGGGRASLPKSPLTSRNSKFCESAGDSPVWKSLTKFRGNIRTNGENGRNRNYYQWDHTHGDIETYDRLGRHLGSVNPITGEFHKPAVPGRVLDGL